MSLFSFFSICETYCTLSAAGHTFPPSEAHDVRQGQTPADRGKTPSGKKEKGPCRLARALKMGKEKAGTYLFSQVVSNQVSSALRSLTSVFGMGTGGTSA